MTALVGSALLPDRFNLARYCLAPGEPRDPSRIGLLVVTGPDLTTDRFSYAELDTAVRSIAAALVEQGLVRGDRVVLRMGNSAAGALLFFGVVAAGMIAVPTSEQLTREEFLRVVDDCSPAAIAIDPTLGLARFPRKSIQWFVPEQLSHWIDAAADGGYADTAADDPAFLVYTSGTTGAPKGVLHAHRSAWGRRPMYQGWYGITPQDVLLHAGALNWTFTLGVGLMDPWANGATAAVYAGPRESTIWPRLIDGVGASLFAAVPGIYRQLLDSLPSATDSGALLPTLRHGLVAGEALPGPLLTRWTQATGRPLLEAFGMSEISTFISQRPDRPVRPGSPGLPQPGRRIAVLDEDGVEVPDGEVGTLAVHRSDPGLFLRYWRSDVQYDSGLATDWSDPGGGDDRHGEWFRTSDVMQVAADGYLIHHGRSDDVMTSMGYRVSPVEVEECLMRHPEVADAGVREREVSDGVRWIVAFVVPTTAADREGLAARLMDHVHVHLARYKCPRQVIVVSELSRTANGKLRRSHLGE